MSTELDPTQGEAASETQQADPITNLKAEMTRKNEKMVSQLEALQQQNAQIAQYLQQLNAPKQPAAAPAGSADKELEDAYYQSPQKYAAMVEARAEERILAKINQQNSYNASIQNTVQSLVQDYPELADQNSALTKKTVEILKGMPAQDQTSPYAYRFAAAEAAQELSVKKRSKRDPDEFAGQSSSYGAPSRERVKSDAQVLKETKEAMAMFGLGDDPERAKRIAARSKRDFKSFAAPQSTTRKK